MYSLFADRNSAAACGVESLTGLPLDDEVEGVADGQHLVDGQGVPTVHEHLLHDLQGRTFALHDAGERAQRGDERRGEGVGEAERLLVGAAVPVVGVDPVEQHVPDRLAAVDASERGLQLGAGLNALGPQQPAVGDEGQVVVAEDDLGEAALLVTEGLVERFLLGAAGAGVGEPAPQVHLPGDERDQRDGAAADTGLDELREFLGLAAEEGTVANGEREPEDELVEEEDDGVVAEPLGVGGDGGQAGVEIDELGLLGVCAEVGLDERRHELLARLARRARRAGPRRSATGPTSPHRAAQTMGRRLRTTSRNPR